SRGGSGQFRESRDRRAAMPALWRPAGAAARRSRGGHPRASQGLPSADRAARRVLPESSDVPLGERRASSRSGGRRAGRGDRGRAEERKRAGWRWPAVIVCRSKSDLERMRAAGRLVGEVLTELAARVAPGVSTGDLDAMAEKRITEAGALPAFKGYHCYP